MANVKISGLPSASSALGTQEFEVNEGGFSKKVTGTQIAAFVGSSVTADPTFTGQSSFPDGSATAPSITHTGDLNTGIYFPASDSVGVVTNGTVAITVDSSANTSIANDLAIGGAVTETPYNLTGTDIDPSNGTIQYKTLSANTTLTSSISTGEAVTLMIDDGAAYTVTWPTMTWVNNGAAAPDLATSGYTVVALWNVAGTLYGALVGDGT